MLKRYGDQASAESTARVDELTNSRPPAIMKPLRSGAGSSARSSISRTRHFRARSTALYVIIRFIACNGRGERPLMPPHLPVAWKAVLAASDRDREASAADIGHHVATSVTTVAG